MGYLWGVLVCKKGIVGVLYRVFLFFAKSNPCPMLLSDSVL